jgi:replicative DNA helicase
MSKYIAIDCERAILGILILARDKREEIMAQVDRGDFGSKSHAEIYRAMLVLQADGKGWDSVVLAEFLKYCPDICDREYLASLTDGLPKELNPAPSIKQLKECRVRRELAATAPQIETLAGEGDGNVVAQAKSLLDGVSLVEEETAPHISEIAEDLTRNLEEIQKGGGKPPGLPTGLSFLDNYIGGIPFRSLVVIAGRPSVGKSSFAMNLSLRAAEKNYKVGIISLEENADDLTMRMLSSMARVNSKSIQIGRLSREEWARFAEAKAKLIKLPLWCDDESVAIEKIQAAAHRFKSQNGLDVLMVDYLQIVSGDRRESRNVQVGEWSGIFKRLTKELKCTVLLVSQLNRSVEAEKRRPRLSDLRDSGAIEQDADMVVFLHNPAMEETERPEEPSPIELHIAKNRHGPKGLIKAVFIPAFTLFEQEAIRNDGM